jgi:hypothetical protein
MSPTCQILQTRQSGLLKILDVAQNEACRKAAGVFCTTPSPFVTTLLRIPPIAYWLRHLLRSAASRLSHLPPSVTLRNPESTCKVMASHAMQSLLLCYPILIDPNNYLTNCPLIPLHHLGLIPTLPYTKNLIKHCHSHYHTPPYTTTPLTPSRSSSNPPPLPNLDTTLDSSLFLSLT